VAREDRRPWAYVIALAVAALSAAAGIQSVPGRASPSSPDVGMAGPAVAGPGAQVYRDNCAACHDQGVNRAPQRMILQDMTPAAILHALTSGAMQPQGAALTEEQRRQVSEYLSGRKLTAAAQVTAAPACTGAAARFDMREPPPFAGWGLDAASSHAIPGNLGGLHPGNVGRLKLKWAFAFPDSSRARSQPTLAGGAILVGNHNGSVYALDRASGCQRWAYPARAEVRTGIVVSPWRAGDAKARPLVYFGDTTGTVYAVNLRDGTLAWSTRADDHPAAIITGTPSLLAGTLYVPVSSNEEAFAATPGYPCCTFRGSVVALDARTGREKWRTWLVDPAVPQPAAKDGTDQFGPSGVAVWNSPSIDIRRRLLFVATGDNYSNPETGLSDSVVALDLRTGRIRWHYQALAGDTWNVACVFKSSANCPDETAADFDFGAGTVLARDKAGRELLFAGQKSGWVYALDPATGRLIWKTRAGQGSAVGGVHFGMAATQGQLIVPINDRDGWGPKDFPASPGLYALDAGTGSFTWKAPLANVCNGRKFCAPGYGGSVTVTGGLAMIGGDDGHLRIYDAASGRVLWDEDTVRDYPTVNGVAGHGGSISGGVAPLAWQGQLIVPSGYGYAGKMPGNLLLVYSVE